MGIFEEIQEDDILKFSQLIVEWHGLTPLDLQFQRRLEILRKVSQTHTPIHVHMNNYGLERNTRTGMLFYADAFEVFKEAGIFNTEVATRFRREVLSKGSSEKEMTLYKRFRGKEPSIDALMRRAGFDLDKR